MSELTRITLSQAGIKAGTLQRFLEEEYRSGVEVHSFMLIWGGKVAAEGWAAPYGREKRHPVFSFSKTLTAAAVGFAVQEGLLSLDEKLTDLFPEYCPPAPSENLKKADIRSLLTMSCGHRSELTMSEVSRFGGNWIAAFLAHPFDYEPGTVFQYNTWGSDLLSAAIQKKTGMTLTQYLTDRLQAPLGMNPLICSGRHLGDSFTSKVEGGGWGMHLTTEDMGRFIWFLRQNGQWEGRQLLDADWVRQMTDRQIETDNPVYRPFDSNWKKGYGWQRWMCDPEGIVRADGAFGQFGIIMPKEDADLVLTAATLNTEADLNCVWDILLPALQGDQTETGGEEAAGCGNSAGETAKSPARSLERLLSGWHVPEIWGVRAPKLEREYDGVRFQADTPGCPSMEDFIAGEGYQGPDGLAVRAVTFRFPQDAREAELHIELCRKADVDTDIYGIRDPFSPAGRKIPKGNEHLICHDGDASETVTQVLKIGLDGRSRLSRLTRYEFTASGRWVNPGTFEMLIRNTECVSAAHVRATFFRGMLTLEAESQLPEESGLTHRATTGMHFTEG